MDLNTIKSKYDYIKDIYFDYSYKAKDIFNIIDYIKPELEERKKYINDRPADDSIFGATIDEADQVSDRPLYCLYKELGKDNILNISFNNFERAEAILKREHDKATDEETKKSFARAYEDILNMAADKIKYLLTELYIIISINNNEELKKIFSLLRFSALKGIQDKNYISIEQRRNGKPFIYQIKAFLDYDTYKKNFTELEKDTTNYLDYGFLVIILFYTLDSLSFIYKANNKELKEQNFFTSSTKSFLKHLKEQHYKYGSNSTDILQNYFDYELYRNPYNADTLFDIVLDLHNYIIKSDVKETAEETPQAIPIFKPTYTPINQNFTITDNTRKYQDDSDNKLYTHLQKNDTDKEINIIKGNDIIRKRAKQIKKKYDGITDDEALQEAIAEFKKEEEQKKNKPQPTTIFDFLTEEELKKSGLTYDIRKDKSELIYIESKTKSVKSILNIDDKQLYLQYGREALKTKKFIEAKAFNFILQNGINALTPATIIGIEPDEYNNFYKTNNDTSYTLDKLENTLTILKRKTIQIDNSDRHSILNLPIKKIESNNKLDEATKQSIISILKNGTLETDFISNFYKGKDTTTNKLNMFITLNPFEIFYLKLIYLSNRIATDETPKPKAIKGNTLKRQRADFIKDLLFWYMKSDKDNRQELKQNNFTQYTHLFTISQLKDKLTENGLLNENNRKYNETIRKPLQETLNYLQDNGIIIYITKAFDFYDEQTANNKRNFKRDFEAQEISITLKNYT